MINEKQCIDLYGERLFVGDEVIPVMSEAAIIGLGGIISEIRYSEQYKNYYITITDKEGKVLLNGVDARCYTTQERFDEMEEDNIVYDLTFYDNTAWSLTSLPLTNRTNPDYKFPEGTAFITLSTMHKTGESSSVHSNKYFFAIKDKVQFYHDEKSNSNYLKVLETGKYRFWITDNHKCFENEEELKSYIKAIIQHFNKADLSCVNNDIIYSENPEGQEFEKTLLRNLKNNSIK